MRVLIATALLVSAPVLAGAQQPEGGVGPACAEAEHRQFDFWLGSWEVRDGAGELQGHNEIRQVSSGCALLERWSGRAGATGYSINFHDEASGTWHQVWVGGGGLILRLEGGLTSEGRMRLVGEPRPSEQGLVADRITWTRLADGAVEQFWEIRPAGAQEWRELFRGIYRRSEAGAAAPAAASPP